jgi:hypothetical protein
MDRDRLTLIIFIATLGALGVLSFVMPKPEISRIENRPLEKPPVLTAGSLLSGDFTDELSAYYSDTFPWRENMIAAAADLKSAFGIRNDGGGENVSIHYGVDTAGGQDDAHAAAAPDDPDADVIADGPTAPGEGDSLAPATGAAIPAAEAETDPATPPPDATPEDEPPEGADDAAQLAGEGTREGGVIVIGDTALEFYGFSKQVNKKYAKIINAFDEKYRGRVTTAALIAPTNIEFKLPDRYADLTNDQRAAISYVYGHLNDDVVKVDVYDSLKAHANEYIYFRTDHHWTQLGAYYAYRDYCEALGLTHAALSSHPQIQLDGFLGSFYNSIGGNKEMREHPDFVLAYAPVVPYEMTGYENSEMKDGFRMNIIRGPEEILISNKYLAFTGGDLPLIDIRMQSDTGRRLIIFKESFANAFIPFLTENYDEIVVVDFRYYEGDVGKLIKKYDINEALFLNYVSAAGSEKQVDRLAALFK